MSQKSISRRAALGSLAGLGAAGLVSGCAQGPSEPPASPPLNLDLNDPVDLAVARQKVIGSVVAEETHSFLRFHFYGQVPGEKARRLLSMNNYIIDYWEPGERGTYKLRHYEVGYYTEFDTDKAISRWVNPYTNEDLEVFHFALGPIHREYSPEAVLAPGLAPVPLNSHVMGDRLVVATEAISQMPNIFQPDEWPKYSSGKTVNWLSLQTLSALLEDVLNPELNSAPAHIQLQNFISWGSWMKMGGYEGGSMARAYGTEISGFDALPPEVLAGFKEHTPEIFETATWDVTRFDEVDYFQKMKKLREAGEV
jgi:hypothetical protein